MLRSVACAMLIGVYARLDEVRAAIAEEIISLQAR